MFCVSSSPAPLMPFLGRSPSWWPLVCSLPLWVHFSSSQILFPAHPLAQPRKPFISTLIICVQFPILLHPKKYFSLFKEISGLGKIWLLIFCAWGLCVSMAANFLTLSRFYGSQIWLHTTRELLKTIPLSITKNIEIFRYKFNKIVKGSLYKTIIFWLQNWIKSK